MTYILTIGGSDVLSGGGIQTDLATFKKKNLFAFSIITSIVSAENLDYQIYEIPTNTLEKQLNTLKNIPFSAIKIGFLPNFEQIELVDRFLNNFQNIPIVLDPVLVFKEIGDKKVTLVTKTLIDLLLPKATIITPNLKEAEIITMGKISAVKDMETSCQKLIALGAKTTFVKGGNRLNTPNALDLFYDGLTFNFLQTDKLDKNANGAGCMLSSTIASYIALGFSTLDAVKMAKRDVFSAIKNGNDYGVNP
ncbi:MAG: bifunctional hydroxymethylpyrimidine kinase/phosphomethylpyrimidine kinase [Streptococcaceae bacterium]|jgi:pyridoxine kinase|nr:bifunctional hydroxymethylpyrimidine kinase/phosphomethylpyrimidine kinase [Streptococcaceae bacterium]